MRQLLENQRILIWGKTRPELSKSYGELVCTGGVLESTRELIRLYPVPLRYLDEQRIFRKYQWIRASIYKSRSDPRPESYRIDFNSIEIEETVPIVNGSWDRRADWVLAARNLVDSVESLQELQRTEKRSLGILEPSEIVQVGFEPISESDKLEWMRKYDATLTQADLPFMTETKRLVKPIPPPDFRFQVSFRCGVEVCQVVHTFSILDWEIDALYHRFKGKYRVPETAAAKVVEKLKTVCGKQNDIRFFLGNISSHPHIFTIVGLWYPNKSRIFANRMPLLRDQ